MKDFELQINSAVESLPANWRGQAENFDLYLKVERNCKEGSRLNYLRALESLSKATQKDLLDITKEDVVRWKAKLMDRVSSRTVTHYSIYVRKFFQWLYHCKKREYPNVVDWIEIKEEHKLPKLELTLDDVKNLADATTNQRDRCLVMLAYDTGCRPSELLGIRLRDIRKDDKGYIIMLKGEKGLKTGERRVRIFPSIPDLELWLSMHPYKDDKETYLFLKRGGDKLNYHGYHWVLNELKKRAKIEHFVSPHSFRHLRATVLCNSLSDTQMKARFGWQADSRMLRTYEHLSGVDVDECFLRAEGVKIEHPKPKTLPLKVCIRGHKNSPSALYCSTCGVPLGIKAPEEIEKTVKEDDRVLAKMMEKPQFKKLLKDAIKEVLEGEKKS